MPNTAVTSIYALSDAELDAVSAGTGRIRQSNHNRTVQVGVNVQPNIAYNSDYASQGGSQSNSQSSSNSNSVS